MSLSKETTKLIAAGGLALSSFLPGCHWTPEVISGQRPEVLLRTRSECVGNKPRINVVFDSQGLERPVIISLSNPVTRKAQLQEVYDTSQHGSVNFDSGIKYTASDGSSRFEPLEPGSELAVTILRRTVINNTNASLVAVQPLARATVTVRSCK